MGSFISLGPNTPAPAPPTGNRPTARSYPISGVIEDGVTVTEEPEEVAREMGALGDPGAMAVKLTQVHARGTRPIYVSKAHIRFVVPKDVGNVTEDQHAA